MASLNADIKVTHGDFNALAKNVKKFVTESANLCTPDFIWIVDGSWEENLTLLKLLEDGETIIRFKAYENSWLARTDPHDVARVESKTFICTERKEETVPTPKPGVDGKVGKWISRENLDKELGERLPGCMKGRTMYVIPYSMGPIGSPLSKIGIELTDSAYVTVCMRIMTRTGTAVLQTLGDGPFVQCLHSEGVPLAQEDTTKKPFHWPCNPEKTIITHIPKERKIISFGSGYGGNSLLGKKCFALRIASVIARDEGWMAEHMLILGITNPQGRTKYITAAFPSACGKTNLAMLTPSIPGWEFRCVGDDIAWMKFDDEGNLRGINPENGFFGVAPGTSDKTNPNAIAAIQKNTIFTNVAMMGDGRYFWEGLEKDYGFEGYGHEDYLKLDMTDWLGHEKWTPQMPNKAAHPNSRFCAPVNQCPIIDPLWEDSRGVPIEAMLFGGRRPTGVPLIYESFNWQHGVFVGLCVKSEATAAAEHKGKNVMHDPFAMRPFFGYNVGHYVQHWLDIGKRPGAKLPKIFHVNWFRQENGKFLWPGFGENARVLEWIFRRCDGEDIAEPTKLGLVPKAGTINIEGLGMKEGEMERLRTTTDEFILEEVQELRKYLEDQINDSLPKEMWDELNGLEERAKSKH